MGEISGGRVVWDLDLDDNKLDKKLPASKRKIAEIGTTAERADRDSNAAFKSILRGGLAIAGIASAVEVVRSSFTAAIGGAANFEKSLNVLRSVSNATGSQMGLLQSKARELGKDLSLPGVSASDAAEAMTELAKAGIGVNDILGASKGVLSLAKAGQLDVANAATIAARALNTFGLRGEDAGKVADLLAAGANASTAGVEDMAQALAQGGAGAKQFGISISDTVAALALFSNAGINGSDAGTSLKTMLQRLAAPTKESANEMKRLGLNFFDAQGNFIGLSRASGALQRALSGLTVEQKNAALATIFGADSSRVAAILADQGAAGYDKMAASVGKVGAATELAAAQNAGFLGALDGLQSTIETIATDVGLKLLPALTDVVTGVSNTLPGLATTVENTFNTIVEKASNFLRNIGTGNFEAVGKTIGSGVAGGIQAGIQGLSVGIGAFKDFFGKINWVDVGVFIVTKIIPGIAIGLLAGLGKLDIVEDILKPLGDNIVPVLLGILSVALAPAKLLAPIGRVIAKIPIVGPFLKWIVGGIRSLAEPIRLAFASLFRGAGGLIGSVFGRIGNVFGTIGKILSAPFKVAVDEIALAIRFLPDTVLGVFKAIGNGILGVRNFIVTAAKTVFGGAVDVIKVVFAPITSFFGNLFRTAFGKIELSFGNVGPWFATKFQQARDAVFSKFVDVGAWFVGRYNDVTRAFSGVAQWFGNIFLSARNSIFSIFGGIGSWFRGRWNEIVRIFGEAGVKVGDAIGNSFRWAINGVVRQAVGIVNKFVDSINAVVGVINKIPGVKIGSLGRLPVPQLAQGGIVTGPTLALIGEGSESEAVIPLSKLNSFIDEAGSRRNDQPSVVVNADFSGIVARSRSEWRDIMKDGVEAINEELRSRGLASQQLGGGALSGGTANA